MDWLTIIFSGLAGAGSGFVTFLIQERKLRTQYKLENSAEKVARELMEVDEWPVRTFNIIRHHIGGFEDDELRKVLVRAGGIRFKSRDDQELWGLLDRNRDKLKTTRLDTVPEVITNSGLYKDD